MRSTAPRRSLVPALTVGLASLAACNSASRGPELQSDGGPACAQSLTAPDVSSTPIPVPGTSWFDGPASPASCADVPGALVKQLLASPSGDAFVLVGTLTGPADFGTGPIRPTNDSWIFLAAFSASGQPLWSQLLGGTTASAAMDRDGSILVVRANVPVIDETGGGGQVDRWSAGGILMWTTDVTFAPDKEHRGLAIAATSSYTYAVAVPGRLLTLSATGEITRQLDYDYVAPLGLAMDPSDDWLIAGISVVTDDAAGPSAFIAKVVPDGQEAWRVPVTGSDVGFALQFMTAGNGSATSMALSGLFDGTIQIGPRAVTVPPAANPDAATEVSGFVTMIDLVGGVSWVDVGVGPADSLAPEGSAGWLAASAGYQIVDLQSLGCGGAVDWARTISGLPAAQVKAAPVPGTTDVLVAGSTNTDECSDCAQCDAPRPFLFRIGRDGMPTAGFQAHH